MFALQNAPSTDPVREEKRAIFKEREAIEKKLRAAQGDLRAMTSEVILAEEKSRQHFATELHDTVVQTLGAAKLRSHLIQNQIQQKAKPTFKEMQDLLLHSIGRPRQIMAELSPPVLNELGVAPALEWLTEEIGKIHLTRLCLLESG